MCLTCACSRGDEQCKERDELKLELVQVYRQLRLYFEQMQKLTAENERLRANLGYRPEKLWGEM